MTTSAEARKTLARSHDALRDAVLETYQRYSAGLTADEVSVFLRRSILAVRPRVTELKKAGLIQPTGERRKNMSGMSAAVLAVV